MAVRPADGGLDDLVQPIEADVRRDEQAVPDRRLDYAAQAELELHDLARPALCCLTRLHARVACPQSGRCWSAAGQITVLTEFAWTSRAD